MSKKIENIDELRAEIIRLQEKSGELKTSMKNDVEELKDYFKPVNIAINVASWFARMKFARPVFSKNGFGEGARAILDPIIDKAFDRILVAITDFLNRRKKSTSEDE